jgi:MoaA/NifB/PqqE/SkfB family radical SAM enzyme
MAVSWIVFHVTDRCQLNCKHCLRDPEKNAHDIDLGLIERVLDQAKTVYGCDHVGLTGGEPTLHPRFDGIVEAIVNRGMTFHMVTNGIRFDARVVRLLDADPRAREALTAVDFSLDGADEAVHDRVRGEGSYRDVMKAVSLSKVRQIPFVLQMAINAYNEHQIESFALAGAALGAKRISFGMTTPTGTYLDEEMFLPRSAWRRIQDRIHRLAEAMTVPITTAEGFHQPRPFHECEPFRSEIIHVDYRGYMNLCCMHAGIAGEAGRSDSIADMNAVSLADGHRRMLDLVQEFRLAKLEAMTKGAIEGWDYFPCNYCLKHFEKPHWTDQGGVGPAAKRERWKGVWAPEKHAGTSIPKERRLRVIA